MADDEGPCDQRPHGDRSCCAPQSSRAQCWRSSARAWHARSLTAVDDARRTVEIAHTVATGVDIGAAQPSYAPMEYRELSGAVPPGSALAVLQAHADQLAEIESTDPCIARYRTNVLGALDEPSSLERFLIMYRVWQEMSELCSIDLSSEPRLAAVVDGYRAFDNLITLEIGMDQVRSDAGIDGPAPSAGSPAPFPPLGAQLRAGATDLQSAIVDGLDSGSAALLADLDTSPSTHLVAAEIEWVRSSETGRVADRPARAELQVGYDALQNGIQDVLRDAAATETERADAHLTSIQRIELLAAVSLALSALGLAAALARLLHTLWRWHRSLRQRAERDELTGITNRAGLRARVEPWFVDRDGVIGLVLVDLDHFKQINDSLGHTAGDKVLAATASRIAGQVVDATSAVSRWGGDEFVVVLRLEAADPLAAITAVANRLQAAIRCPVDIDGTLVSVEATMGCAICDCGSCQLDDVFRSADHLLYAAKEAGRGGHRIERCVQSTAPIDEPAPIAGD